VLVGVLVELLVNGGGEVTAGGAVEIEIGADTDEVGARFSGVADRSRTAKDVGDAELDR